jgi:retron-type reverse transcriptase
MTDQLKAIRADLAIRSDYFASVLQGRVPRVDDLASVRRELERKAEDLFAKILHSASSLSIDPAQLLRNLLAETNRHTLPVYQTALSIGPSVITGFPDELLVALGRQAGRPQGGHELILSLLRQDTSPSAVVVRRFLAVFPDQNYRERFDAAVLAVERRDFSRAGGVEELLDDVGGNRRVLRALRKAITGLTIARRRPASKALLGKIRNIPDEDLRDTLGIVARPAGKWYLRWKRLPTLRQRAVLDLLPHRECVRLLSHHPLPGLLEMVRAGDPGAALYVHSTRQWARLLVKRGLPEMRRALGFWPQKTALLSALIQTPRPPAAISRSMLSLALEHGDIEHALIVMGHHPVDPARNLSPQLQLRLANLLVAAKRLDCQSLLPFLSHRFIRSHTRRLKSLLNRFVWSARRATSPWRGEFMSSLVDSGPKSLAAAFASGITCAEARSLWVSASGFTKADRQRLLRLPSLQQGPVWKLVLRQAREQSEIPTALIRTIELATDKTLSEAALLAPEAFGPAAVRRLSTRQVMRIGLKHPSIGAVLDDKISHAARLRQLPWVRKQYAESKQLATAYELATAFSFADGRYLAHLSTLLSQELTGASFDSLYRTYQLPKRKGGTREIAEPSPGLKRLQRRLSDRCLGRFRLTTAARGFRKGFSIVDNARPHVGHDLVANVDIKSFFSETKHTQVLRACRVAAPKLSPRALRFMAELLCRNGALPTGAPSSPATANIILTPVDRALLKAAKRYGIVYTRYADDLTFSGNDSPQKIIPFAARILGQYGYEIEERKTNLYRKGRRQIVTGLVVNEKPNVARRDRRRLRSAVYRRITGGIPEWNGRPMSDMQLLGYVAFLAQVQPEEAARYKLLLKKALGS